MDLDIGDFLQNDIREIGTRIFGLWDFGFGIIVGYLQKVCQKLYYTHTQKILELGQWYFSFSLKPSTINFKQTLKQFDFLPPSAHRYHHSFHHLLPPRLTDAYTRANSTYRSWWRGEGLYSLPAECLRLRMRAANKSYTGRPSRLINLFIKRKHDGDNQLPVRRGWGRGLYKIGSN